MSTAPHVLAPGDRPAAPRRQDTAGPGRPNAAVWAAAGTALAAALGWAFLLAGVGGDLAAQWAWADFAARHPGAASDLAWYGGLSPAAYSVLSPPLMALLGVRTVAVLSATAAAALLARLLVRAGVHRPMPAALWGAVALGCNVAAGRVTFALGCAFGLAALVVAGPAPSPDVGRPGRPRAAVPRAAASRTPVPRAAAWWTAVPRAAAWWTAAWRTPAWRTAAWRTAGAAGCALLATLASPVAGLFVEVAAAALLLTGRRRVGIALALPFPAALAVIGVLFPFQGVDPITPTTVVLCAVTVLAVLLLAPRDWRTLRMGAAVYGAGAVAAGLFDTPVGANVQRLALLYGAVVLLAVRGARSASSRRRSAVLWAACAASALWTVQGNLVGLPAPSATHLGDSLVAELRRTGADRARVEAVPMLNHWESWGLAGTVELARGWNRQADLERHPLFYDGTLTPAGYRDWLRRWAVGYVVLPTGATDYAARDEAAVVRSGPAWLQEVWHDAHWRLYRFTDAVPLAVPLAAPTTGPLAGPTTEPLAASAGPRAAASAVVDRADAAEVVLTVGSAGWVEVRLPWSGRLSAQGPAGTCLARSGEWTALYAPAPGTYRIGARYTRLAGTPCGPARRSG